MRASKAERDTSFATFMDQSGPALLRTAWFLTGDADHAAELTESAFVQTYLVWPKVDHDRALPYARRCLVNHKIDVRRASRHEVADPSAGLDLGSASPESASPESASQGSAAQGSLDGAVASTDHRDDLVRRLSRLPEQQRKIVVLRYYANQSEVSVADALGISVGAVKSAASLGLTALRAQAPTQIPNVSSPEGLGDDHRP